MAQVSEGHRYRAPHRKSKLGCFNCKLARKKCDEARPICSNCVRRQLECGFPSSLSPDTPTSRSTPVARPPPEPQEVSRSTLLAYTDLELLHHYTMHNSEIFSSDVSNQFYLSAIPAIGFQHHYVLHLMLALSAIHMHRTHHRPLAPEAEFHYTVGLRGASGAFQHLSDDTSGALVASTVLIFIYELAQGPRPDEYLFFNANGSDTRCHMLRRIRNIVDLAGPPPSLVGLEAPTHKSRPRLYQPNFHEPLQQLELNLLKIHEQIGGANRSHHAYALTALREVFEGVYVRFYPDVFKQVFSWIYEVEDAFNMDLQNKDISALIILAHFLVLFREAKSWFTQGWIEHIWKGLRVHIGEQYAEYISWPAEEIES